MKKKSLKVRGGGGEMYETFSQRNTIAQLLVSVLKKK